MGRDNDAQLTPGGRREWKEPWTCYLLLSLTPLRKPSDVLCSVSPTPVHTYMWP